MISDQKINDTMPSTASRRHLSGRTRGLRGNVKRIERARADVAEDDAHARKRHRCPGAYRSRLGCGANLRGGTHKERSVAGYQTIPQARPV